MRRARTRTRAAAAGIAVVLALFVLGMLQRPGAVRAAAAPAGNQQLSAPLNDDCPGGWHHRPGRGRNDHSDDNTCYPDNDDSSYQPYQPYQQVPPPPPPLQGYNVPPGTPIGLQPSSVLPTSVTFTWSPSSGFPTGYWAYTSSPTSEVPVSTTSYTVNNLSPGTYVCITVLAYNSAGFSAWSNWSCATTPAVSPVFNPAFPAQSCAPGLIATVNGCVPPPPPTSCAPGQYGCTMPGYGGNCVYPNIYYNPINGTCGP